MKAPVGLLSDRTVLHSKVDYYAASQNQRDLLDSIALHEYQLKKAHEQGLKRSEVPPFLGLKRSDRSNDMPA